MRFRLVTYNIHKCIGGVDRRYRPLRVIETLARYDPDVALLQEVDDRVPRSHRHRQVDLLGESLGFRHRVFQANVKLREGAYGNAILSRYPLTDVEHLDLTVPFKKKRRALVAHCRLSIDGRARRLLICNVHLGLAGFERAMQLRRLLRSGLLVHTHHRTPVIAAGDPNLPNRSVAELELSVRSRKCLQRLGINTLGELISRSEAELMAIKNFGQTSLVEIERRLGELGLSLRESAI